MFITLTLVVWVKLMPVRTVKLESSVSYRKRKSSVEPESSLEGGEIYRWRWWMTEWTCMERRGTRTTHHSISRTI